MEKNEMGGAYSTYGGVERLQRVLVSKPEGDSLRVLGVDWIIMLRWIYRKLDVELWTGSSWLRIGARGGHLKMQ